MENIFCHYFHFKSFPETRKERRDSQTHKRTNTKRESSSTSTSTKPKSRLTSTKFRPAQPSSDHVDALPRSCAGQTPKTHKHWSTQILAHPSLTTDPPLRSPTIHRRAPILTTDRRLCSTRLSNTLAATTDRWSGHHRPPAHSTPPLNPPDLTTAASIHSDSLFPDLSFPQSLALSSPSH